MHDFCNAIFHKTIVVAHNSTEFFPFEKYTSYIHFIYISYFHHFHFQTGPWCSAVRRGPSPAGLNGHVDLRLSVWKHGQTSLRNVQVSIYLLLNCIYYPRINVSYAFHSLISLGGGKVCRIFCGVSISHFYCLFAHIEWVVFLFVIFPDGI